MIDTFYLGKILYTLCAPSTLLLVWFVLAVLLSFGRWRVLWIGMPVFLLVVTGIGPVADWILWPLEQRFPPSPKERLAQPDISGIIVLGGGLDPERSALYHGVELTEAADRIMMAGALATQNPRLRVIISGGSGDPMNQTHREADYIAGMLRQWGVAGDRIFIENKSRRTAEHPSAIVNKVAEQTGKAPEVPGQTWLLVTSAAHMPRAVGVFRKAGWAVIPVPVDYRAVPNFMPVIGDGPARGWARTDAAVHEWLGLVSYYIDDYMDEIFPAPRVSP